MQHGGFEAGEREFEPVGNHRAREVVTRWIPCARQLLDRGAARIAEAEQRGDLVERFAGRVIAGLTEQPVAAPGGHVEQQRVST